MKKLTLLLSMLLLSLTISSQEVSKWDGVSSSTNWFFRGNGHTYYINSAEDLAGLVKLIRPGYYFSFANATVVLNTDIDLNDHEWEPIGGYYPGNYYYTFNGIFDGNGKTITGLKISQFRSSSIPSVGLFGGIIFASNAVIKNLTLKGNITVSHKDINASIGAIAGTNYGTISNCRTDVNITVTASEDAYKKSYIGGVVGNNRGPIFNCESKGSITATHNNENDGIVAGIAGNNASTISECSSSSAITIIGGKQSFIGGITCYGSVSNSIYSGNINVVSGMNILVGGISVSTDSETKISNCLMVGSITGSSTWLTIGAINTFNGGSVTNCYYLSGTSNSSGQGTSTSEATLKSGNPLNGFDTNIWSFVQGRYPFLAFTEVKYWFSIKSEQGEISQQYPENTKLTLRVAPQDDWSIDAIFWNGADITNLLNQGILETPSLNSDAIMQVVYRSTATSQENIFSKVSVGVNGNSIIIRQAEINSDVLIYDMSGRLLMQGRVSSDHEVISNLGSNKVVIVKVDGQTFKVAL
ncbi:MAG: hypothetical protein ACRCTF_08905 [Bacteroidales bacterium]